MFIVSGAPLISHLIVCLNCGEEGAEMECLCVTEAVYLDAQQPLQKFKRNFAHCNLHSKSYDFVLGTFCLFSFGGD